jgi:hypothetical protein
MKVSLFSAIKIASIIGLMLISASVFQVLAQTDQSRQLQQIASERRLALIIGNGAYTNAPPLKNPPNDARDMAAALKGLGFDVTSGININQREMKRLIREFGQKLKGGGSGLFYYAGHGVQSKGRNYLIPVDADIQSEAEAEDAGVDVSLVLNYMDEAQNALNIVILDACRNNPFSGSFRSASEGLAQVDAPTGTLIAYATAPGRVASDGTGSNGLYTSELLKQMTVPGVSVTDMFMHVRAEVMKATGNKQVPWESSSLVGQFYFSGAAKPTAEKPAFGNTPSSKVDPAAIELTYWETIKNSSDAGDFKSYLDKYPEGQFVALAKNKISSLQPNETSTTNSQAEITFWDSIKNSNRPEDYRAYLNRYPNGVFSELAKSRLVPLDAKKEAEKGPQPPAETKPVTFEVKNGLSRFLPEGTLYISAAGLEFKVAGHADKDRTIPCSGITEIKQSSKKSGNDMRVETKGTAGEHTFTARNSREAVTIVQAVISACHLH